MAKQDYFSVRMSTLKGGLEVPFDLYIHLNEKYIHYLREGDLFEKQRYKKLKEKKLKKLYILNEQEEDYLNFIEQAVNQALDPESPLSNEQKSHILQGRQESNVEQALENPEDEEKYQQTKEDLEKYIQFIGDNPNALKYFSTFEEEDPDIASHCVQVTNWSIALAKELGLDEKKILSLSMGAMLHDIGRVDMDENSSYEDHPFQGANRVKDLNHYDADVIHIIMQHEEKMDGSGYPKGLGENQIHELAIIVGLANTFENLMTKNSYEAKEAVKKLLTNEVGRYPLGHIQALQKIVNQNT